MKSIPVSWHCIISATVTLALISISTVSANPISKQFELGVIHGKRVRGVVKELPTPYAPDIVKVQVYCQIKGGKSSPKIIDVGESYSSEVRSGVYAFTKKHSKQLFVATKIGAVHTYIYDFSGKQLKAIYTMDTGRIYVTPKRDKSGLYYIEEEWSRNQWQGREDLGVGKYDPKSRCFTRILYWNGQKFTQRNPRTSSIEK